MDIRTIGLAAAHAPRKIWLQRYRSETSEVAHTPVPQDETPSADRSRTFPPEHHAPESADRIALPAAKDTQRIPRTVSRDSGSTREQFPAYDAAHALSALKRDSTPQSAMRRNRSSLEDLADICLREVGAAASRRVGKRPRLAITDPVEVRKLHVLQQWRQDAGALLASLRYPSVAIHERARNAGTLIDGLLDRTIASTPQQIADLQRQAAALFRAVPAETPEIERAQRFFALRPESPELSGTPSGMSDAEAFGVQRRQLAKHLQIYNKPSGAPDTEAALLAGSLPQAIALLHNVAVDPQRCATLAYRAEYRAYAARDNGIGAVREFLEPLQNACVEILRQEAGSTEVRAKLALNLLVDAHPQMQPSQRDILEKAARTLAESRPGANISKRIRRELADIDARRSS